MSKGRFGIHGGQYIPETLMNAVLELEEAYNHYKDDPEFNRELTDLLNNYAGRPSRLYYAAHMTEDLGGAKVYLKREDLNHTGAHKINNVLGQVLLAKKMGKTRVIAETGAGQHGVATATAAALMGMECEVFMGKKDTERQALNVYRMRLLGAKVHAVTSGTATLKDAVSETMREWTNRISDTHYVLGSVMGPHPFPTIVRDFQAVISKEIKEQILEKEGKLPDAVLACVGGGSNAIGTFYNFIEDEGVRLIGCEAAGRGVNTAETAATIATGKLGIFHGMKSYFCQDEYGQIAPVYSISAGLDYPGIGPEHAYLHDIGRAEYVPVTDDEAVEAFEYLSRIEGIIPAIESAHAVAHAMKLAPTMGRDKIIVINISGRGDKSTDLYEKADKFAKTLTMNKVAELDDKEDYEAKFDGDYLIDEKAKTCNLLPNGVAKAEKYFGVENLMDPENTTLLHHINQAIRANGIMKLDIDYVIKDGEIVIVDEFTGRLMFGRRYNDGLHQAIEAKEGVKVNRESKTLATITFQNFFRLYDKLSGMTGTAMTEESEFRQIYSLDVIEIPTNKPVIRIDNHDQIYKNERGKFKAVCDQVEACHKKGQPVLVGTVTIEKSELVSKLLKARGIKHQVLNAKNHEREAEIVAQAGKKGAITIATNMAGRGTDIMLGGNVTYMAKAALKKELSKALTADLAQLKDEYEHAKARGAKIYAEICGYGSTCDAYHETSPDPEGKGGAMAMKFAYQEAGMKPEDINYINAHGTSTSMNDRTETMAIKEAFGDHAKNIAVNSTKSMTGHLLGAAGGVEAVVTAMSIRNSKVHMTLGYKVPDPECDLDYVTEGARDMKITGALSNSLGFGGHNGCICMRPVD